MQSTSDDGNEPAGTLAEEPDTAQWMDALASGKWTADEFAAQVLAQEDSDPEIVWEVLALLDQHFRRKRIDRETFTTLKARLQRHSLGSDGRARGKAPPRPAAPQSDPVPAAPLTRSPAPDPHASTDTFDDALELRHGNVRTHRPDAAGPVLRVADDLDEEPASSISTSGLRVAPGELPPMRAIDSEPPPAGAVLLDATFHREVRPGDVLCGRYRAVEILRRRDWMSTLEAVDEARAAMPGIRQRVTVHVLDEDLSQDPLLLQRIGKLQVLSHPSILRVLDVQEDNGALVLVTEFFSGISLRELLERRTDRRVPLQSALSIVRALAGALAHAHASGVAHGDLTASNVLITDLGEARLHGFELRAQSHAVQPSVDRMAFARLAYELLAGTAEPIAPMTPLAVHRLRAPPGITRTQWRALRDTLSGREGAADADVLAAFGGEALVSAEPVLFQDGGSTPALRRRSHAREWLAAGVVAAVLGSGTYLYLDALPASGTAMTADTSQQRDPNAGNPAGNGHPAADAATIAAAPSGDSTDTQAAPAIAATTGNPATAATPTVEAPAAPANPQPAVRAPPPPARPSIDLASTYAWVDTSEPVARIWVMRRGSLNREVTFRWWTETGTAQVDHDFRAIEPRLGVIPEGSRGVELLVPLMPDPTRREPRTFYVKIDEPGPGADLGTRTLMQVAIVPPGYPAARDTRAAQNVTPGAIP